MISITLQESPLQRVAGIPASITVTTNVPATVFYTLDGSTPDTFSDVYINPIIMPTNVGTVTLKLFATNGIDTSPIIEEEYGPVLDLRQARDEVTLLNQACAKPSYPFGSGPNPPFGLYGMIGGLTVDALGAAQIPDGYNGQGGISNYTNLPITDYELKYSETDNIGQMGKGIGTLPGQVTEVPIPQPPESSDAQSAFFNPKALVIFQDSSIEQYDADVPRTNRPYFALESNEKTRYGRNLMQVSSALTTTGGFVRQYFNPAKNELTFYYYDNSVGRWIISKEPYKPTAYEQNYASIAYSHRNPGDRYVYKWIPFQYRKLY